MSIDRQPHQRASRSAVFRQQRRHDTDRWNARLPAGRAFLCALSARSGDTHTSAQWGLLAGRQKYQLSDTHPVYTLHGRPSHINALQTSPRRRPVVKSEKFSEPHVPERSFEGHNFPLFPNPPPNSWKNWLLSFLVELSAAAEVPRLVVAVQINIIRIISCANPGIIGRFPIACVQHVTAV